MDGWMDVVCTKAKRDGFLFLANPSVLLHCCPSFLLSPRQIACSIIGKHSTHKRALLYAFFSLSSACRPFSSSCSWKSLRHVSHCDSRFFSEQVGVLNSCTAAGVCAVAEEMGFAMNTRRHLTDEQRHLAIARLQVGGRQSDVARELGVSQSVISRLASRHRTAGRVRDRPRSGAPQVTDRSDDQYLRTYALRHRNATATQLQARLRDVRGTRVQTNHSQPTPPLWLECQTTVAGDSTDTKTSP
ncbi:hypothetical protein L3Q82_000365 [Scortum barcoo]|uniref:Uncharacterized protein n=1 Tax=Scortum barcoo TaxID=214431 RepID=A0ACB8XD55_9TELE|nr:hypothetical protein L3Q82_000365 [Scortum barcoo]